VSNHERRLAPPLRPRIPVVDVHVRAADAGAPDADQDLVFADAGLLDILQLKAGCGGLFDERFHERVLRLLSVFIERGLQAANCEPRVKASMF